MIMEPDITLPKEKEIMIYSCLVSQTGTADPTQIILKNDFEPVEAEWSRNTAGAYELVFDSNVLTNKTGCEIGVTGGVMSINKTAADTVVVTTEDSSNTLADGILNKTMVKIEKYKN